VLCSPEAIATFAVTPSVRLSRGQRPTMARASEIRASARAAADEAQRGEIASAACRVISAEGLEAASLRRIGAELGCTTGLITHYFPSKEQLLIAALRWASTRLTERVGSQAVVRPETLREYLDFYYASLPLDEERRTYWIVLLAFRGATIGNPTLGHIYREYSDDMERAFREVLGRETNFASDDPDVVRTAKGLSALFEGVGISASEAPALWTEQFVRSIVEPAAEGLLASLHQSVATTSESVNIQSFKDV